jgi:hypothetical protein
MDNLQKEKNVVKPRDKKPTETETKVQLVKENQWVGPNGYVYEIWDGDTTGWTKVKSTRR